ncbi:MAG: glutamate--tRNA ligase [Acidobacteriota bacterium]
MSGNNAGPIRVRFAPSPTGFLHVGGARTAIYNDLLRQRLGGAFVLRIEDTDRARSDEAMIQQICQGLEWAGIPWDEGPILQSAGVERHRAAARRLLDEGKAYPCFRTREELDAARAEKEKERVIFRYREVFEPPSEEEAKRRIDAGEPFVVRFRMPAGPVAFHDLVRGDVEFPEETQDDFILLRSDGSPTYHLSVVCDDIEMEITHVIRGEDHLSNTPKHVPLFRALGGQVPVFAHLPLILGSDKKRLSKRTGATSVEEFRDQGLLPQALYNALALLGWSPGEDREILTRDEMVELFSTERLNSSAAVFDRDKLAWLNAHYMNQVSFEEILERVQPFLEAQGLAGFEGDKLERLHRVLALHRSRAKTLVELAEMAPAYFAEEQTYEVERCGKFLKQPQLPAWLETLKARYGAAKSFDLETLEAILRELATEVEVKAGVLIHPVRMALTATKAGPPLFDVVEVMGREATERHLANFIAFLQRHAVEAEG